MKEAMGTSMVFNLMMIFISVFIALLIGSIAYSKGFKIRNRIIDIIEAHDGYDNSAIAEIDENLSAIGYRIVKQDCADRNNVKALKNVSDYNYCIYRYKSQSREGTKNGYGEYYGVTVFIHFDFPLIGNFINIPLYGETRTIYDKSEVEG